MTKHSRSVVLLAIGLSALSGQVADAQNETPSEGFVRLTVDAVDEGLDAYKIETSSATYFLDKKGAGIGSMIDRDGVDWLSWSPGTRGPNYRGFPNAVWTGANKHINLDKGAFHPWNDGTGSHTTKVERNDESRVTISAVSENGEWEATYDFYPTHCTFTMTKMPPQGRYWILYEGTPGGEFEKPTDWWMASSNRKANTDQNHETDLPAPEWMVFGDPKSQRVIYFLSHTDDDLSDLYYGAGGFTVFGFGREGTSVPTTTAHLTNTPRSFSLGFLETTKFAEINAALKGLVSAQR